MHGRLRILLFSLIVSGCSAAGDPTPLSPEIGQCGPEEIPVELPVASDFLDVNSLDRQLVDLVGDDTPGDSAYVLLTLAFDLDGSNIHRLVFEHTVSPVVADSVQKLVFANLERTAEASEPWGVRLKVSLADSGDLEVERRIQCPPVPRNSDMRFAMERFGTVGGGDHAILEVIVHPNGYVEDARVVRGATSGGTFERQLVSYIRRFFFEPATVDEIPVFGTILVPVRVR